MRNCLFRGERSHHRIHVLYLKVQLVIALGVGLAIGIGGCGESTFHANTAPANSNLGLHTTDPTRAVLPAVPSWTLNSRPDLSTSPVGSFDNLMGVSCPTSDSCIAVGYSRVAENGSFKNYLVRWNGTRWSVDTSSGLSDDSSISNYLAAVSCPSVNFCTAVGGFNYRVSTGQDEVLIWNGRRWSLNTTTALSTSRHQNDFMSGVSCTSPSFCMATGGYIDPEGAAQSYLLSWTGGRWKMDDSPSLSTSPNLYNDLISDSCASPTFCVAVGASYNGKTRQSVSHNLLLTWNGSNWSRTTVPDGGTAGSALNWVSCASPKFCVAVGGYFSQGYGQNFLLVWNGSRWIVDANPALSNSLPEKNLNRSINSPSNTVPSETNGFNSISCISTTYCVAIGNYMGVGNTEQNFVETWNGSTWSLDASPGLSVSTGSSGVLGSMKSSVLANLFNSVSCAPSGFCAAAGNYFAFSGIPTGAGRDFILTSSWPSN